MKESDFRRWICQSLRQEGADCQTVETSTGNGVPDVNVCWRGIEFWLELKCIPSTIPYIRASQHAWSMRRNQAGGLVFLVIYNTKRREIHLWDMPISNTSPLRGSMLKVNELSKRWCPKKDFNIKFILE